MMIKSIMTATMTPIINPSLGSGVRGVLGDGVVVLTGGLTTGGLITTSVAACVGREDNNMRVKTMC